MWKQNTNWIRVFMFCLVYIFSIYLGSKVQICSEICFPVKSSSNLFFFMVKSRLPESRHLFNVEKPWIVDEFSKCLFTFLLTFTNWIRYNFKYSSILLLFFGLVLSWTLAAPFSSRCISDILWQKLHNTFTEQLFVSASISYLDAKKRQSWLFFKRQLD